MADSGSPITILSVVTFLDKWNAKIKLEQTDVSPKVFGETEIDMLGYFMPKMEWLGRHTVTKVNVAIKVRNRIRLQDLDKIGLYLVLGSKNPIVLGDNPIGYMVESLHVVCWEFKKIWGGQALSSLNRNILIDCYLLPKNRVACQVGGSKFFSIIDLCSYDILHSLGLSKASS